MNNAYENSRGGGRHLSKEARRFKTETPAYLIQHFRAEMLFFNDKKDVRLTAMACVMFPELENETWGKKKDVARYKKLDATNRVKFLEDALKEATGTVDDSQFFPFAIHKFQRPAEETHIWVWDPGKEESPLDELFGQLLLAS